MKSPQQIADEKFPLPFTADAVAIQNCTCYTCQIARREGFIAGMQEAQQANEAAFKAGWDAANSEQPRKFQFDEKVREHDWGNFLSGKQETEL